MASIERDPAAEDALPARGISSRIAAAIDRLVIAIARHWLALFNALAALFIAFPFLAPALMHVGATRAGRLIYTVYSPTCHQLPERSFFLFGPQAIYTPAELESLDALPPGLTLLQRERLRFVGTPRTGYKIAICERDVATYLAILLAGLVFGAFRHRYRQNGRRLPKLPLWGYALLLAPMAVDGLSQLVGLRESDWILRTITGALFGGGTVWLAYPYVQDAMDDVIRTSRTRAVSLAQTVRQTGQDGPDAV